MKSFNEFVDDMITFAKGSKEVAGGICKITPYLALLATGGISDGNVLTLAVIIASAAGAVEGTSNLLDVLATNKKKATDVPTEERFELAYHLLCQAAYAEAVKEVLPSLPQAILEASIDPAAMADPRSDDPANSRTEWNWDLDFLKADIPLFNACSRRLVFFLQAAGLPEDAIPATLGMINGKARKLLKLHLTTNKSPYDWIYDYVQLDTLAKVRATTDSLPEQIAVAISEAADRFVDPAKTAGVKRAWEAYRQYITSLPDTKNLSQNVIRSV